MKWILIILFGLNAVLLASQWFDSRSKVAPSVYVESGEGMTLKLLTEFGSDSSEGRCVLLGPLQTKKKAQKLSTALMESGGAKLVIHKLEKAPTYWVYINN